MEQIKQSVVQALKKKFGMEVVPDGEFIEWWRRNHGTGYALQIVPDREGVKGESYSSIPHSRDTQ